jgi:hypothetical protein
MPLKYTRAVAQDATAACRMIGQVFGEFVAPGYEQNGVNTFMSYAEATAMSKRLMSGEHFGFIAKDDDAIAGYIEIRGNEHVSLMFVDKSRHKKGICRELFYLATTECLTRNPDLKSITVNSSPFAVIVYEHLGFYATDAEQEKNGIRYVPMSFDLKTNTTGM